MNSGHKDVVIVGGGVAGVATAYYLGKAGISSVVVEKDSVGSHASGFAYGGLSPLGGAGIPGPVFPLASEGMRLHAELATDLPEETGINTEYRPVPGIRLALSANEVREVKAGLEWQQRQAGYLVRWVDGGEARTLEPRISPDALGAVVTEGTAEVEPYRFVLALAQAAEGLGATIRHGRVNGLLKEGGRVRGVVLEGEEVASDRVVLAMGPWSGECAAWLDVPVPITPLKGQILRLRVAGPPFRHSLWWEGSYVTTKPDGLAWAGTTEEDAGFHESPTTEGRDGVMRSLLQMVPSLVDAELVQQTACLRPLSADGLPVLGPAPGHEGVYLSTGAGRKGIILGPAMGKVIADLIATGDTDVPIDAFDPARFA